MSVANGVTFTDFCKVLEKIESIKDAGKFGHKRRRGADRLAERRHLMKKFIEKWRSFHKQLHANKQHTSDSFYPAMRLLLPYRDKDREPYGLKEHMLAKQLIKLLALNPKSPDALKLLNYRTPANVMSEDVGDFGSIILDVMRDRELSDSNRSRLSLAQLNEQLDKLAGANTANDRELQCKTLLNLLKSVEDIEAKWLCRIILKQMKLGISDNTMLQLFHSEAQTLYNHTNDLEKVCRLLHEPGAKLHEVQIEIFVSFCPMLAYRTSAFAKVPEIMKGKPFFIETKYDGERVQLHKDGGEYKYFSRNGYEYTIKYGGSPTDTFGSLTPFIHKQFSSDIKSCILDGEMVGWSKTTECIVTKGDKFDVKTLKPGDDIHPCFVAFDCVYLNGVPLTGKPLTYRLECLASLFTPLDTFLIQADRKMALTEQDIVDAFNTAIENREEGIVVKRPDSIYKVNVRSTDAGWLKIKPDYFDDKDIMSDLDFLIVGGSYGDGRRSGIFSHFLLAVAVPPDIEGEKPHEFKTVATVGSGYSEVELYKLNIQLAKKPCSKVKPSFIECRSEKPDVWFEPQNSFILQIKAAELQYTKAFATMYTTRFPRVERVRYDKSWYDCITTTEFEDIQKESDGKLARARAKPSRKDGDDLPEPATKKNRKTTARKNRILGGLFRPADVTNVNQKSETFKGLEICVKTDAGKTKKQDMEKAIFQLGGTFVQNPSGNTCCIVAEKETLQVKTFIKSKQYDVVKTDWLLRCMQRKQNLPWRPSDIWFARPETEKTLQENFDEFGDGYTEECNVGQLRDLMNSIQLTPARILNSACVAAVEEKYIRNYKYSLFRSKRIYVDYCTKVNDPSSRMSCSKLDLTALQLRLYGAVLVEQTDQCTHVLIHSGDLDRLETFGVTVNESVFIVTEKWVEASLTAHKILSEKNFVPC